MKISKDNLTIQTIERLVNQGYEVVVEADSEWIDISKPLLEEQPNVAA